MQAKIKHETINGVLVLHDLTTGTRDNGVTIAADAQAVIHHCIQNLGLKRDTPVIFDARGSWDQLLHDGVEFIRINKLSRFAKDEAVLLVQDPSYDSGGDFWKFHKIVNQERRAAHRESGPQILQQHGVKYFEVKNGGAHIIIGQPAVLHFWPGTQRWIHVRVKNINGRGTQKLIDWIKKNQPNLLNGEQ